MGRENGTKSVRRSESSESERGLARPCSSQTTPPPRHTHPETLPRSRWTTGSVSMGRGSLAEQGEVTREEARERRTNNRAEHKGGQDAAESGTWPTLNLESQASDAKPRNRNGPCFCGKNGEMSPHPLWLTPT